MRFSVNIFAAAFLLFSSTALAAYEHDIDSIIARHENDLVLEARGEMTEFEARAMLIARAPNGDCGTASPQRKGANDCLQAGGHGWKSINGACYGRQQMLLQGNQIKGWCYY